MKPRKDQRRRRILLLADFAYASGKAVASGVIRFVSSHSGIDLLIHGRTSEMPKMLERLVPTSRIDGIISCFGNDMNFMHGLLESLPRVPVVFASVGRGVASVSARRSAAIFCDHAAVAGAAADLLVRHGLSNFGYVGSRYEKAVATWDAERRDAFCSAIAKHGLRATVYSPSSADADDELTSLSSWLRALPKPCGILVSDDMRAMHVLNVCHADGIAVPEQIQVVGVDNEEWICCNTSPTLSSVEVDFEGCGQQAAETLLAMLEGRKCAHEASFGIRRVMQRMSTADMHGSVNRAVMAREWLLANCCRRIEGSEAAAALGCSVRTLQLSYKSVFGLTMQQDLIDMRLEHARRLLSDTDVPVCRVPECCGAKAASHFMRLFKTRTGMTMLQYRHAKCAVHNAHRPLRRYRPPPSAEQRANSR